MKITAIKQQAKRRGRYSIYIDEKFAIGLSESELLRLGLFLGQELTQDELALFKDQSNQSKWFDKVLNLLSYRPRSEWEIKEYLRRKDCPPEIIESLLNKLSVNGYVNDEQFARRWIESRRQLKPTSRRKIAMELKVKRIDNSIIDEVLTADKSDTDELQIIKDLITKKGQRYPDRVKLMQYLARQGFSYEDIKRAINDSDSL